jgi:hypothetical protein
VCNGVDFILVPRLYLLVIFSVAIENISIAMYEIIEFILRNRNKKFVVFLYVILPLYTCTFISYNVKKTRLLCLFAYIIVNDMR